MDGVDYGSVAEQIMEGGPGFFEGGGTDFPITPTPNPSWWSSFGNVAKSALPWLQGGTALAGGAATIQGMRQLAEQSGIARSAEKRQSGVAKQAQEAAGPLRAFGEQQLSQAAAGKVDPAIEKQIGLWMQGAKQKAQDFAARSGQGDSSQLVEWLSWIEQMGDAMRIQAIQGEQQLGLQAEGAFGNLLNVERGASSEGGASARGEMQSLQQLIAMANQELAKLSQGAA